jgi:hypothetical protein
MARRHGVETPLTTEGGHIAFAPTDEIEIEILRSLVKQFGRVSVERILSGPGMEDLHLSLAEAEGRKVDPLPAKQITERAVEGCADSLATVDPLLRHSGLDGGRHRPGAGRAGRGVHRRRHRATDHRFAGSRSVPRPVRGQGPVRGLHEGDPDPRDPASPYRPDRRGCGDDAGRAGLGLLAEAFHLRARRARHDKAVMAYCVASR